jgi:hypothetical protein
MSNHPGTLPVGTTQPTATNLTGAGYGNAVPEAKAGPHTSRIANAADASVDSSLGSRGTGIHPGANATASTGAPLHTSSLLNKLDPRVDSNMDGFGNMGATQTQGQTAHTHTGGTSGYGPGVGPGIHAGVPGTGVGLKQTPGTGTATQTAGPHNSNLLNKLDPRVDSDMDGSQTIGGNRTYV